MKKTPKLSEMEHVTSIEFGMNMNNIMDRVLSEDTGIIIDTEDKSYVLCPANWFEILEMQDIETMIKVAVRYAAVMDDSDIEVIADMLMEVLPTLSDECIKSLLKTIDNQNTNMRSDRWQEMTVALEKAITTTEKEE